MKAKKQSLKTLLVISLIALGVCYGLEIAQNGTESVQGPFTPVTVQPTAAGTTIILQTPTPAITPVPAPTPAPVTPQPSAAETTSPQIGPDSPLVTEMATTSQIANKTGDLLQVVSHHGIQWVVGLFDKVLK
ncbi:hypothetical protein SY83_14535 [Paenibacillus swuensis]|uniref:Uncharacterized protein n=1 Tax=Paenibacillus swuensis TaxID=1178515 RepID=A0A172TKI9_9BACL|nr:hypothetical protein [Paenibacillus swuensis]ANE47283.1 hypothetical protein SY83_14535 [Paenibacillus swuensis]